MSEQKEKKLPRETPEQDLQESDKSDYTTENSKIEQQDLKVGANAATAGISDHQSTVAGKIPPWDDDNDDSGQEDNSRTPNITAEVSPELGKIRTQPIVTGEIPPWDDEEESQ